MRKKIVVGDIHGGWNEFHKKMKDFDIKNSNFYILGDVGVGFENVEKEKRTLKYFDDIFKGMNNRIYCLRGNHDNPDWFDKKFRRRIGLKLTNIFLVDDYSVLKHGKDTFLFIGGSVSIDQLVRKENVNFWSKEEFKYDYNKLYKNLKKMYTERFYVLAHDIPKECFEFKSEDLKRYNFVTDYVIDKVDKQRLEFSKLFDFFYNNFLIIKKYYSGHYHTSKNLNFLNIDIDLLNIMEFKEIK